MQKKIETVKQLIFWSYANLAMAHTAVDRNQERYSGFNFMIRTKLFKGLTNGNMNIRSLFDDEKVKMNVGNKCNYCGCTYNLTLDHLFPRKYGGLDDSNNLLTVCKSCNSSKGSKDLMQWMREKNTFLPLMVVRRYLKLVYYYCLEHQLLDLSIEECSKLELPFDINMIPIDFPSPKDLILMV